MNVIEQSGQSHVRAVPVSGRYPRGVRWLHWLGFVLVLIAYVSINARVLFEKGTPERLLMAESHFLAGVLVMALALPRILRRWAVAMPAVVPVPSLPERLLAMSVQAALYAFLIVEPLLGVVTRMAQGRDIGLPFTEYAIPAVIAADPALAATCERLHIGIGEAFYYVIGLHVLAALWHGMVRRDGVLRRMC